MGRYTLPSPPTARSQTSRRHDAIPCVPGTRNVPLVHGQRLAPVPSDATRNLVDQFPVRAVPLARDESPQRGVDRRRRDINQQRKREPQQPILHRGSFHRCPHHRHCSSTRDPWYATTSKSGCVYVCCLNAGAWRSCVQDVFVIRGRRAGVQRESSTACGFFSCPWAYLTSFDGRPRSRLANSSLISSSDSARRFAPRPTPHRSERHREP